MKQLLKQILPPVLSRAARRMKLRLTSAPAWHEVQAGPLKGVPLFVNPRNSGYAEMIKGSYDQYFIKFLEAHKIQPRCFLDVGAQIGYHSLAIASNMDSAQVCVYAFEPNPANQVRMQTILDKNPELAKRIELVKVALSDSNDTREFNFSDNVDSGYSFGGFLENASPPAEQGSYEQAGFKVQAVRTQTLDDFLSENPSVAPDLIKIDVEGAEVAVLKGAERTLKNHRPCMLLEVHSTYTMYECGALLREWGYEFELLEKKGQGVLYFGLKPRENTPQV